MQSEDQAAHNHENPADPSSSQGAAGSPRTSQGGGITESEEIFRAIFDASQEAIFLETLEGQILDCNIVACKMYGYSKEEMLTLSVIDLVPNQIAKTIPTIIAQELETGSYSVEATNRRKDGTLFPVEVKTRMIALGERKLVAVYIRDISRRIKARKDLHEMAEALQHRAEEMAAVHAVSLNLTDSQPLPDLLEIIVEQAVNLLKGSGGGFYLCDPILQEVRCVVSYRTQGDFTGVVMKYGEGVAGKVAQTGQPLVIEDYRTWSGRALVYEEGKPFRAVISVPVTWRGQVTGVLHVLDDSEGRLFTAQDLEILSLFANQSAIAIENSRLLEIERRRRLEAETLHQATISLSSTLDLSNVLDKILTSLKLVVNYDSATVFLLEKGFLRAKASRGLPDPDSVLGIDMPANDALFVRIQQTRQPLILDNVQNNPDFHGWGGTQQIHSWMGIPMIVQNEVTGYLTCDHHLPAVYSSRDIMLAQAFANQAATAIENARLFETERAQLLLAQTLQEVGALLTSQSGLSEVLENLLELLSHVIEYDSASIHLLDSSGKLYLAAGRGFEDQEKARQIVQDLSSSMLHSKWVDPKLIVIPDTYTDKRWEIYPDTNYIRSWIGAPLMVKGRFIGSLNIDSRTAYTYNAAIGETAMAFAHQAALAIENARLIEGERKQIVELEALRQASIGLTSSLELRPVLHAILRSALDLLPEAGNAHIFLYNDTAGERLTFGAALWSDGPRDTPWSIPRSDGLTYSVARSGLPIIVPDMRHHPMFSGTPESWVGAIVGLPLKISSRVIGVMNVSFQQPRQIPEADLRVLQLLGDQAAIAIQNASLFEQAAMERRHLRLLSDINREVSSSLNPDEILTRTIELTCQVLGTVVGEAFSYIPEENRLSLRAFFGRRIDSLRELDIKMNLRLDHGLAGWVAAHRQAVHLPEVEADPRWMFIPKVDDDVHSAISAPILAGDKLLGVLTVMHREAVGFTEEHLNLLKSICQEVSLALEKANLYEQVRDHAKSLESTVAQRTAELTELYQLSQEIGYPLSFEELLNLLLQHLQKAVGSEVVVGCLSLDGCNSINVIIDRPAANTLVRELYSLCAETLFSDRKALSIESMPVKLLPSEGYNTQLRSIDHLEAFIQAPILIGQELVGFLAIGSDQPGVFGPTHERLLNTFANQAASAIQRLSIMLTAQQRQLESLVQHLPVGVLLLDSEFRLLLANPIGRELYLLLNPETSIDMGVLQHLGPFSLEELISRQGSLPTQVTLGGPPQRIIAIQIRSTSGAKETAQPQWVVMLSDITQEREDLARIQIQDRLATVGQLAAGIAHDFNNIMAAILVYTDLLQYDQGLSQPGQEKLAIIHHQIQRASSLIRQILDFSRKSVMEQNALDLLPLMKELDKMLARVLPETIQLNFKYEPGAYWVKGDPTRLQQIFINLALNARDAMPAGGILRFELATYRLENGKPPPLPDMPAGDWVRIRIQDTGSGISAEVSEHLYEPFFTTKPVGQGTGLGLAQVYGIVKNHDGFIGVESQVNQGTTFTIYLPALPEAHYDETHAESLPRLSSEGLVVLIVEDDASTLQALRTFLEFRGCTVLTASNGVEALRKYDRSAESISLVISDMVMPEMGGVELFELLRAKQPDLKILLITGHPLDEKNQDFLETGNVRWLQKPFSIHDLSQAINLLLEN
ncbi:MAG: GAF domain-containing protein [Anaerolineales bacterium]|nr:GAF domain-containing protein [Anaerolineales bacterium]